MFVMLVILNVVTWAMLAAALVSTLRDVDPQPQLGLSRRAWRASQRIASEASRLGPLYKRFSLMSLHLLSLVEAAAAELAPSSFAARVLPARVRPLFVRVDERRLRRLEHVVEQLEELARVLSRHRAGLSALRELEVPLRCLDRELAMQRKQLARVA